MKKTPFLRYGLTALTTMFFMSACEIDVGDEETDSSSKSSSTPIVNNPPKNTGGNTGGNTDNGNTPDPDNGVAAPAVPAALNPGGGESFSGAGAKVTFVWTDAEGAAQFELLVQGLGSGGWQTAVHQVTDNFQASYTFSNTDWTQYRWAVRSIGSDDQVSAFTAWRAFTWSP